MYNPDAIIYRRERGLLKYAEQMGILIQEVVGTRIGPYFMPVFAGGDAQREALASWLDGWSKALAKSHFLQTGFMAQDILDVHIITDECILKKDSYAMKIDSITDPASLLRSV